MTTISAGKTVRVRIAPSPTGIPHIGNTRTALFNYLFAKHNSGTFILRIEDTDRKRIVPGAREAIMEILSWLGLEADEKYVQSERLELYKKHAGILTEKRVAYKKDGAIWASVPKGKVFSWIDAVGDKTITFKSDFVEDFVIMKSDGYPTYHFANVVDDYLMNISHVIRGDEWISSTPKHLFLYESFSWKPPVFAHLPVILGPDKTKLSKRHGAESVLYYQDQGYLQEALLNFMVLLGWNPGQDREIMDISIMIKLFDLSAVNTGSPIFDSKKLEWINGIYIRAKSVSELETIICKKKNKLISALNQQQMEQLVAIVQTRMKTVNDFFTLTTPFIAKGKDDSKLKNSKKKEELYKRLKMLSVWKKNAIETLLRDFMSEKKLQFPDVYTMIIGKPSGLPLADTFAILGKERILDLVRET